MSVTDSECHASENFANRNGDVTDNKMVASDSFYKRNGNKWSMFSRQPVTDCGKCGHSFNSSETVFRAYLPNKYGRSVKTDICGECADSISSPYRQFDTPRPCEFCSRPVGIQLSDRYIRRVFCSDLCRGRETDRRNRQRRLSARQKLCTECGSKFGAKRKDAKTCSPACKQRAYRARQGAV